MRLGAAGIRAAEKVSGASRVSATSAEMDETNYLMRIVYVFYFNTFKLILLFANTSFNDYLYLNIILKMLIHNYELSLFSFRPNKFQLLRFLAQTYYFTKTSSNISNLHNLLSIPCLRMSIKFISSLNDF